MRALLVAAAGVALLAGCGDDDEDQPQAGTTTVVTTVTQTAPGPRAASQPRPRRVTQLTGFSSPSKNIGCYIGPDGARCDILRRDWRPPPKPRDCELDYGQGIGLAAGRKPVIVCAGDTALGSNSKLAYGTSIQSRVVRCDSKRSGMTCTDTRTGRGFTLSRERYRLF